MNTGESRMVAEGGGPATSIASILLSLRGNTLVAQGFDPARGLLGDPQSIGGAEDIENSVQAGPQFSASSTVLVYRPRLNRRSQLAWLDREGRHIGTIGDVGDYEGVAISPTGRSLAVTRRDGPNDAASLWRLDVSSDRIERLTPGSSHDPVWSPDGTRVAYRSERDNRDSTVGLYATSAEGGGTEDVLLRSNESKRPTDWSKDGRVLIYTMRSPKTGTDVWALPTTGDAQPFPVVQTAGNDSRGVLSPDGRWIAYASDESGSEEVFVRAFPPSNGRWQISSSGGTQPRWRADGRELFYLSEEGAVTSVDISTGREGTDKPTLRIGVPRMLFEIHGADDFAVSPDGRFLVSMSLDDSSDRALEVVLNWASELRLLSH